MPVDKGLPCRSCAHTPPECLIAAEVRQINRRDHLTLRSIHGTGSENIALLCKTRRYSSLGDFYMYAYLVKKNGFVGPLQLYQFLQRQAYFKVNASIRFHKLG